MLEIDSLMTKKGSSLIENTYIKFYNLYSIDIVYFRYKMSFRFVF